MGCFPAKEEALRELSAYRPLPQATDGKGQMIPLKKGGVLIRTAVGFVQYGIPPETLKDTMEMGCEVPEYFLVPDKKINTEDGISLMEFEFPVYYNFFLKNRVRTKLICDGATAHAIRTIFQETLLGPKSLADFAEDFTRGYAGIPDMRKELDYFAQNSALSGKKFEFDMFIQFVILNEGESTVLEKTAEGRTQRVTLEKVDGDFIFYEEKKEIARITEDVKLQQNNFFVWETLTNEEFALFDPPTFGVTMLGSSHGFDVCASTTGFIVWINKKGIMVDPPPYSSSALREQGIPPNFIQKIIITHCHADHDSGAFHKVIESSPVEVLSTRTIINSFLRKYSAVTNLTFEELSHLFQYRFVEIGHPTFILGARFTFGYSFHSIPTICFEVEFEGKRFYFSGDTYFDPDRLLELKNEGLFSQERFEYLAKRDFSRYDLILHEAGIPPIHTPVSVLAALPKEVKERTYLIHVAKRDVPEDSGLRVCCVGLKNTITLVAGSSDPQAEIFDKMNLLSDIELINWVPFSRIYEAMKCFREEKFEEGASIIAEGTSGNTFYIIKTGIVRISSETQASSVYKLLCRGDYFGESAVTGSGIRLATVVAMTPVEVLAIDGADFKWVFSFRSESFKRSRAPIDMIKNLSEMRKLRQAEFVNLNSTISRLTENQKSLINMLIKEELVTKGSVLWEAGQKAPYCFFIKSGKYQVKIPYQKLEKNLSIRTGTLVGDFPALLKHQACDSTVRCLEDGVIFKFSRQELHDYLIQYPGFAIVLKDKYIIM